MGFEHIYGWDDVAPDALFHHTDLANIIVALSSLLDKIRVVYSAASSVFWGTLVAHTQTADGVFTMLND